jgi:hypothetical protein
MSSPTEQAKYDLGRSVRAYILSVLMVAVFAGVFLIGQAAAAGLDSNLVGGMTVWQGLIVCAIVAIIGIAWLITTEGKAIGAWLVFLIPVIVAFLVVAAALSAPINQNQTTPGTATYEITNAAALLANYTPGSHMFTSVLSVNKTTPSLNATATYAVFNFTVLRNDPGNAYDVRAMSFSFVPSSITSALTGISYSTVKPNGDGRPNCNWTVYATSGASVTSRSLSGTAGMTPYESINVVVSVEINPAAIGVSQTAVNDVLNLGAFTIAGQPYAWQGLVNAIWI